MSKDNVQTDMTVLTEMQAGIDLDISHLYASMAHEEQLRVHLQLAEARTAALRKHFAVVKDLKGFAEACVRRAMIDGDRYRKIQAIKEYIDRTRKHLAEAKIDIENAAARIGINP